MGEKIPDRTVSRLIKFRRSLLLCQAKKRNFIFSHELAQFHHITPVQVRRDIMLIGYKRENILRRGYSVNALLKKIDDVLDAKEELKIALVGVGDLGKSLLHYFSVRPTKLVITAAFDKHPNKIGKIYSNVKCYDFSDVKKIIKKEKISIVIIAVPGNEAIDVAEILVGANIKGILNYTPTTINVPNHIYLEEIDMISSLEKVAYFVKNED